MPMLLESRNLPLFIIHFLLVAFVRPLIDRIGWLPDILSIVSSPPLPSLEKRFWPIWSLNTRLFIFKRETRRHFQNYL